MFEFLYNLVETLRRPFISTHSRLQHTRLKHTRATTFIEYAILALIVIAIGGVIYGILTNSIEGVFSRVASFFDSI
jgi:Flp pilus assembly pilin Flp